jgi:hypothetical protein
MLTALVAPFGGFMSLRPRSRLSWALVASVALAASLLPATAASAGGGTKTSSYSATISPAQATVGQPMTFTITVSNAKTSSNGIGSVQVVVPAGFDAVTPGTSTTPSGWVYSMPPCSSDSPVGCSAGTLVQVNTPSNSGANKVLAGGTLAFSITATPTAKGQSTWTTAAKNSAAWSTGQLLTETGGDPVVTAYGAAARLAFVSSPQTSVTAGTTFGATVVILDAQGAPTLSAASVSLGGTSLGGTTTVAAVDGTATFSGLSLTKAGVITITATSAGLSPDHVDVSVTPAAPAKLVVAGPTTATAGVTAGGPFVVDVTVTDTYDNPVNPEVSVSLSVDGVPQPAQTTLDGSTSFSVDAPTSAGTHSYTVSSSGLTRSFDFTVVAAPATNLTIDSVAAESGAGALSTNAPFDVVVTARDDYGNPSPYTGSVMLSTSGGTGSGLGALSGSTSANFTDTSTMTFTGVTYTGYGNTIDLTAATDPTSPPLHAGQTSIDVNLFVTVQNVAPKQNVTVTNSGCTDATPQVPVCSSLILPNGANGTVTLSQGACIPYTTCLTGPQNQALLVEGLADLTGLYTRAKPAAIELRCDKTLCGGAGATSFAILYQPSATASNPTPSFAVAPPCPSKGRIGPDQTFCQDLAQDHRDNAGDLVAYLLFLDDAKASFG